jgi:hypothetical protein
MQFTPRVCGGIVEGLPRMIIELNRGTPAPVRLSIPSNRAALKEPGYGQGDTLEDTGMESRGSRTQAESKGVAPWPVEASADARLTVKVLTGRVRYCGRFYPPKLRRRRG